MNKRAIERSRSDLLKALSMYSDDSYNSVFISSHSQKKAELCQSRLDRAVTSVMVAPLHTNCPSFSSYSLKMLILEQVLNTRIVYLQFWLSEAYIQMPYTVDMYQAPMLSSIAHNFGRAA